MFLPSENIILISIPVLSKYRMVKFYLNFIDFFYIIFYNLFLERRPTVSNLIAAAVLPPRATKSNFVISALSTIWLLWILYYIFKSQVPGSAMRGSWASFCLPRPRFGCYNNFAKKWVWLYNFGWVYWKLFVRLNRWSFFIEIAVCGKSGTLGLLLWSVAWELRIFKICLIHSCSALAHQKPILRSTCVMRFVVEKSSRMASIPVGLEQTSE